ncbi:sodium hydrogen exchange transporter [Streptococcus pneumoniae]|nr:sodium hydrogen exchange transporter [Streptococcus pneumoniae]
MRQDQENQDDQEDWAALKLLILSIESDGLEQAYEEGNISNRAYRVYQRYLKNIEQGKAREDTPVLDYLVSRES